MLKKAMYPGSFDPFTNGHLDIVKKSAALFDEVYVIIGVNATKHRSFECNQMVKAIQDTMKDLKLDNVYVMALDGLVAEYAKEHNIQYMIRGLRNNMDYNYEENIAEVNKLINPDMEYIYFRAEEVGLSSSMVKELLWYNQDVSSFLPKAVYKIVKKKS